MCNLCEIHNNMRVNNSMQIFIFGCKTIFYKKKNRFVKCMDDHPKCLSHTRDAHIHSSPSEDSSASSNHWMNFKSCGDIRYKNSKLTQSSFTQRFQSIPTRVVLVTLLAFCYFDYSHCVHNFPMFWAFIHTSSTVL